MTVGIKVDFLWFPIGTGDFFHSFFSTICANLEDMNWGSKFPVIMKELYSGNLPKEKVETAKEELECITLGLKKISPDKVVWDIEDLKKMPPWGDAISPEITNLSEYFITTDGKNLIEVINEALNEALYENIGLEVKEL